jgi:hypothetical protein
MLELRGPSGDGRAGEYWLVWRKGVVGDEGNCVANMVTVEVWLSGFRGSDVEARGLSSLILLSGPLESRL